MPIYHKNYSNPQILAKNQNFFFAYSKLISVMELFYQVYL